MYFWALVHRYSTHIISRRGRDWSLGILTLGNQPSPNLVAYPAIEFLECQLSVFTIAKEPTGE